MHGSDTRVWVVTLAMALLGLAGILIGHSGADDPQSALATAPSPAPAAASAGASGKESSAGTARLNPYKRWIVVERLDKQAGSGEMTANKLEGKVQNAKYLAADDKNLAAGDMAEVRLLDTQTAHLKKEEGDVEALAGEANLKKIQEKERKDSAKAKADEETLERLSSKEEGADFGSNSHDLTKKMLLKLESLSKRVRLENSRLEKDWAEENALENGKSATAGSIWKRRATDDSRLSKRFRDRSIALEARAQKESKVVGRLKAKLEAVTSKFHCLRKEARLVVTGPSVMVDEESVQGGVSRAEKKCQ